MLAGSTFLKPFGQEAHSPRMSTARNPSAQILNQCGGNKNSTQQQASKTPEPVKQPRTYPILNYIAFFQECFFEISVFFFQELHKILAVALSLERGSDEWAVTGQQTSTKDQEASISFMGHTVSDTVEKNSSDTKANGIADLQKQNRKSKTRQQANCEGKDVVC